MNSNTIAKFHLFGKVGKIVMTVLFRNRSAYNS